MSGNPRHRQKQKNGTSGSRRFSVGQGMVSETGSRSGNYVHWSKRASCVRSARSCNFCSMRCCGRASGVLAVAGPAFSRLLERCNCSSRAEAPEVGAPAAPAVEAWSLPARVGGRTARRTTRGRGHAEVRAGRCLQSSGPRCRREGRAGHKHAPQGFGEPPSSVMQAKPGWTESFQRAPRGPGCESGAKRGRQV
ncbi:unnamed protein product [Durusdinium trenchii]|uniref:Uncharacterized protein n=1 Tax=Durusdinium trenchii TaxID=1381693 RepID=A0ABP0QZF5_9DINO